MALYSYVVARDFGFAPNPFFDYCTLACCKPDVRKNAKVGDWIVGTGGAEQSLTGHLVYAMKVEETMSFDQYWHDHRFNVKRPNMDGSRKIAYGDNIYHHEMGLWVQSNSHHSYENGVQNLSNLTTDTRVDRVLISKSFKYWGGAAPKIPPNLRNFDGHDLCIGRGYKKNFPDALVHEFEDWYYSLEGEGYIARPGSW